MSEILVFFMLMSAPSASDIHVENHAIQIDRLPTQALCENRAKLGSFYSSRHYWCEELRIPADEYYIHPQTLFN